MNVAAQQQSSNSAAAIWEYSRELRLAGKPAEALKLLRKALAAGSRDYRIHNELGSCLIDLNRNEEAIGSFLAALQLNSDCDEACNEIGSALAARGIFEPAAHWFERARQLNPAGSKYLYNYGCVLLEIDRRQEAAAVFDQWVKAEPGNPIARHLASAVLDSPSLSKASPEYVRALFDNCATRFDEKLASLKYRGPELVFRALTSVAVAPAVGRRVLDAGCGTGLVGVALKPLASQLVGVDLSAGMLDVARQRAIYDELIHSDIIDYLRNRDQEFDVIASADVLTYIGDVNDFFTFSARALRPGGRVVVVVEALKTSEDFRLNLNGRFSHNQHYLTNAIQRAGLALENLYEDVMRHESLKPVPTWVAVASLCGK
jgi:predicted TPR repeat methyltransferase